MMVVVVVVAAAAAVVVAVELEPGRDAHDFRHFLNSVMSSEG